MKRQSYPEHARRLPNRPPDWRWRRANQLSSDPDSGHGWIEDRATQSAVVYVRDQLTQATASPNDSPFGLALNLYQKNEQTTWKLEALVLASQPGDAIAAKLQLTPEIVATYESMFFDVRLRLTRVSWIAGLFGRSLHFGFAEDDLSGLWKWIGFRFGAENLDLAIAVTTNVGRENYAASDLEHAAFFIEWARIPIDKKPEQMIRLENRLRAEQAGLPPSAYYQCRRRKHQGDAPHASDPLDPDSFKDWKDLFPRRRKHQGEAPDGPNPLDPNSLKDWKDLFPGLVEVHPDEDEEDGEITGNPFDLDDDGGLDDL